jgi:hypothetical protein
VVAVLGDDVVEVVDMGLSGATRKPNPSVEPEVVPPLDPAAGEVFIDGVLDKVGDFF